MARQTKPLSVKEIESAKPKEADYVLYDGDGLELLIKSTGSKIWQFRYIRPVTKSVRRRVFGLTHQLPSAMHQLKQAFQKGETLNSIKALMTK